MASALVAGAPVKVNLPLFWEYSVSLVALPTGVEPIAGSALALGCLIVDR